MGHAIAAAAEIVTGHKVRFSPFATYTMARMFARASWREPLVDDGAYPLLATRALQKHGFVSDAHTLTLNEELPFDMLEEGVTHRLAQYYRIPSGPGAYEGVRRSIASGNPVTIAVTCDGSFEHSDGRVPIPSPSGSTRGSHYIVCVGTSGELVRILNSWGPEWGDGGYAWLTPERIEHPTTVDLQCIDVVEA